MLGYPNISAGSKFPDESLFIIRKNRKTDIKQIKIAHRKIEEKKYTEYL
jgi:hypothetical protein